MFSSCILASSWTDLGVDLEHLGRPLVVKSQPSGSHGRLLETWGRQGLILYQFGIDLGALGCSLDVLGRSLGVLWRSLGV